MANRYWVGGTDNWNTTAGTKWATTSGGSGGASAPTTADDVFFDANSGTGTVTIDSNSGCKTLNTTGFTGLIAGSSNLELLGNLTIGSGTNLTYTGTFRFTHTGTNSTLTSNGKTLYKIEIDTNSTSFGTVFLGDALTITEIRLTSGAFSASGEDVTISSALISTSILHRNLYLGSGTWTLTGSGTVWDLTSINLLVYPNLSTIKFTGSGFKLFNGGARYYHILSNEASGTLSLSGGNVINTLQTTVRPFTLQFGAGSSNAISSMISVNGTPGNLVTIESGTAGTQATLQMSTGSAVYFDYVYVRDINKTGTSTWYATNSVNAGNNVGWIFGGGAFMQFF